MSFLPIIYLCINCKWVLRCILINNINIIYLNLIYVCENFFLEKLYYILLKIRGGNKVVPIRNWLAKFRPSRIFN